MFSRPASLGQSLERVLIIPLTHVEMPASVDVPALVISCGGCWAIFPILIFFFCFVRTQILIVVCVHSGFQLYTGMSVWIMCFSCAAYWLLLKSLVYFRARHNDSAAARAVNSRLLLVLQPRLPIFCQHSSNEFAGNILLPD